MSGKQWHKTVKPASANVLLSSEHIGLFSFTSYLAGATQTLSGAAISEFVTSVVTLTRWSPPFPFGAAWKTT